MREDGEGRPGKKLSVGMNTQLLQGFVQEYWTSHERRCKVDICFHFEPTIRPWTLGGPTTPLAPKLPLPSCPPAADGSGSGIAIRPDPGECDIGIDATKSTCDMKLFFKGSM